MFIFVQKERGEDVDTIDTVAFMLNMNQDNEKNENQEALHFLVSANVNRKISRQ